MFVLVLILACRGSAFSNIMLRHGEDHTDEVGGGEVEEFCRRPGFGDEVKEREWKSGWQNAIDQRN